MKTSKQEFHHPYLTPKIYANLPIKNNKHKQWANFIAQRRIPRGCGAHALSMVKALCVRILIQKYREKGVFQGGWLVALQSFWLLKRVLELLISFRMSTFPIIWAYWLDTISPWGKKKKIITNKYTSVIFVLAKNTKFRIFAEGSLKSLQQGSRIRRA